MSVWRARKNFFRATAATVFGLCLFVPVVAGLYVRPLGQPHALAVAAGIAAMVAVHLATRAAFGIVTPAFAGIALSIVGCAVVVLL